MPAAIRESEPRRHPRHPSHSSASLDGDELADYAVRSETRHEHLAELRRLYGFRSFSGGAARELGERLRDEAEQAQSNEDLARRFVEACRRTRTILPATTTIERLCADALVDAERRIEARITERVPPGLRRDLKHLLEETADAGVTRFVWLRQFEPGSNSADANRLLDRLEHVRRLDVPEGLFHEIPPHRITRLRRQGERYFADGLRELPDNRRVAILAVCAVEWEMFLADAVVETHDTVVGRTYREAARACEAQLGDETAAVRESLREHVEAGRRRLREESSRARDRPRLDPVRHEHRRQRPRRRARHPPDHRGRRAPRGPELTQLVTYERLLTFDLRCMVLSGGTP